MSPILVLESGWRPGLIGRMVEMHTRYYARTWGFDARFEARLAQELGAFVERFDPERDFLLAALEDDEVFGSVVIDSGGRGVLASSAELRWFIVDSPGRGVGRHMLAAAMDHVDRVGYQRSHLSTFQRPAEARRLYEEFGFCFVTERETEISGVPLLSQEYVRTRP